MNLFLRLSTLAALSAVAGHLICADVVSEAGIELFTGDKVETVTEFSYPVVAGTQAFTRMYRDDGKMGDLGLGWSTETMPGNLISVSPCPPPTPTPVVGNLSAAVGNVSDPCPAMPAVSSQYSYCYSDGILNHIFASCGWTESPAQSGMLLRMSDGETVLFSSENPTTGPYSSPPGVTDTLLATGTGYKLVAVNGSAWLFGSGGAVTGQSDANGNLTTMATTSLSGGGSVTTVTSPGGRSYAMTYNAAGLITSVQDPAGQEYTYTYDSLTRLAQVSGPGPGTADDLPSAGSSQPYSGNSSGYLATYSYDSLGRMVGKNDAKSGGILTYIYGSNGKVASDSDGLGRLRHQYLYDSPTQVRVIGGRGETTTYLFNGEGWLTRWTGPDGTVQNYSLDQNGDVTQLVVQPGDGSATRTTNLQYNSLSELTYVQDPLGNVEQWRYAPGNPSCGCVAGAIWHQDKNGNVDTRALDVAGNVTVTTDALGDNAFYYYNSMGERTRMVDARGNQTTYTYDPQGDLTNIVSPAGTVRYGVDTLGRVYSVTDELGHQTRYALDGFGNALVTTYDDNSAVVSSYDAHANLTNQSLQAAQGQTPAGSTSYTYDAADELTQVKDPENAVTSFTYDADGNRTTVTDPLGQVWQSEIDMLNRVYGQKDPANGYTRYVLDAFGNRLSVTDADGNETQYTYDLMNRLLSVTDADKNTIQFTYDAFGNRRTMLDANGHQTQWHYDVREMLANEIDAKGVTVKSYGYDPDGNVQTLTDGNGVVTTYGYDGANRLISETPSQGTTYTYAYGSPTSPNLGYNLYTVTDPRGTETFLYDDLDRLTSDTKPTGEVLAHQYDPRGNRLQTRLTFRSGVTNAPVVEKWAYDLDNRNTTATDAAGGVKTLAYDPDSRLTQENLPNQLISTYTYDHANRLLGLVTADNMGSAVAMSNYKLDAVGNRMSKETIAENDSYTYDNTYQLTGVRTKWAQLQADTQSNPINHVASGVTMTVSVAYDPMGNRSSYQETYTGGVASLSKSYGYSPANEMLNDGGVSQTFDNNGNLTNRGGVAYTWDARNRLTGVGSGWSAVYDYTNRLALKNNTDYIFDDNGWLWSEVNASSGVPKNIYSYDNFGLIGQATLWANSTGRLQQTYFLYDGLGSMLAVTDQSNKTIATYATDAFGVQSSYSNYDTPFMYTGRWGGLTDNKVGVLNWYRWYLPEQSKWGSRDPDDIWGGWNLYGYVNNDPTSSFDWMGLYNCTYSISRHTMTCTPNNPADPPFSSSNYVSGNNTNGSCSNCQNNPSKTGVPNQGPAPTGTYSVGPQHRGNGRRNLTPTTPNGRPGIQTHGCSDPSKCSDGCLAATSNATRDAFNAAMNRETPNTVTVVP